MKNLSLGEKVPNIALPEAGGTTYNLSDDLKEREGWRFIIYFRGTW